MAVLKHASAIGLTAILLTGCALVETSTSPLPSSTHSDAEQLLQEAENAALLQSLQTAALSSTGSSRFLSSGVLEMGPAEAAATLTVFTEYHCTYCSEFEREYVAKLQRDFMHRGALKLHYIILPLQKYQNSELTMRALLCAGKTGQGEQMHEALLTNTNIQRASILKSATALGLNKVAFSECLESEWTDRLVGEHRQLAEKLEVTLVPTFFLQGEKQVGLPLYPDVRGWIRQALKIEN